MAKLTRYRVLREHDGDRFYNTGETREARAADVAHLVGRVLEPLGEVEAADDAEKGEPAPLNKAEDAAPANKASGRKATPAG